jgi:protein TonB
MRLFTEKGFSSTASIILHVLIFALIIYYFNQRITGMNDQNIEIGFGGTEETNSPGSPGSGSEEDNTPPEVLKPVPKPVEKEKNKTNEDIISDKSKPVKNISKDNSGSDSNKANSSGQLAASGGGAGGSGNGNGQPGSGAPKKGLYIPNDIYYVAVDQMPVPVGGMNGINERAFYPPQASADNVQGTVYVLAFVDERGYVKKVSLIKGIGYGCDLSAMQAVKNTHFEPGSLHGVPVKVQLTVPVIFKAN